MVKRGGSGPEFVRFFGPLLDALRELGDSGRPKEVAARIAEQLHIEDAELNRTNANGLRRFDNQVAWARFYLAKAGLIDTSRYGVWTLTDLGRGRHLGAQDALEVFKAVQKTFKGPRQPDISGNADAPSEIGPGGNQEQPREDTSFREELVRVLRSLSSNGFERLSLLILRELGFEEVTVIGKSGDGGIDGIGTLRINRVLTDRVVFQCKRYSSSIPVSDVREFGRAMQGRAERGIFLATSKFTAEAEREATRPGASPVQLVDLETLISLMTELKLGVRTVLAVDYAFFSDYMPAGQSDRPRVSNAVDGPLRPERPRKSA